MLQHGCGFTRILHTCGYAYFTYMCYVHNLNSWYMHTLLPKYIQTNVCMHSMVACVVCAPPLSPSKQQLTPAHTRCCTTICERSDQTSSSSQKQKRNKKKMHVKRMQAARSSRLWWQLVLLVRMRCRCGSCVSVLEYTSIMSMCAYSYTPYRHSHTRIHTILIYVIMHA